MSEPVPRLSRSLRVHYEPTEVAALARVVMADAEAYGKRFLPLPRTSALEADADGQPRRTGYGHPHRRISKPGLALARSELTAVISPQSSRCFWPVVEARTIASIRRCRLTAASKPGLAGVPLRMLFASCTYSCATL
jgi:hypothetical protein